MRRKSIVKSLTVVAALSTCAVAAPTAFARTDIPLKPDTSKAVVVTGQGNHIAPPDTSKAVVVSQQPSTSSNDLRSPDAIAAAADPRTRTYASPTVVKLSSDSGFDWGDAGIGAGGALAVVALAGGGLLLVSRRRTTHSGVSAATS
jgi:hypothetical protein